MYQYHDIELDATILHLVTCPGETNYNIMRQKQLDQLAWYLEKHFNPQPLLIKGPMPELKWKRYTPGLFKVWFEESSNYDRSESM